MGSWFIPCTAGAGHWCCSHTCHSGQSRLRSGALKRAPSLPLPLVGRPPDLSPVQQQLSEMNHRYHLLGVRLSDRQQEADALSEELRACTEALRTLATFAKGRSVPRELPSTRELADQQLQQLRQLQAELQERQLEVDRARLQAQELLRRRPQAPGADALQAQLDELLGRWQALQGALRSRLLLLQLLREFQVGVPRLSRSGGQFGLLVNRDSNLYCSMGDCLFYWQTGTAACISFKKPCILPEWIVYHWSICICSSASQVVHPC